MRMMLQQVENCLKLDLDGSILLDWSSIWLYFPNASKTWMIVKKEKFEKHKMYLMVLVLMSHMQEGKRYLGATLWD